MKKTKERMRAGDLVKHDPTGGAQTSLKDIFEDWGWMPDFCHGIILEIKGDHALVHCLDNNTTVPYLKTDWYEISHLRHIDETR